MNKLFLFLVLSARLLTAQNIKWYDAKEIGVSGKGFSATESYFDRLPAIAKGIVYKDVWRLSRHSSGLYIKFYSASDTVFINYSLTSPSLNLPHMPVTGVSGLDLYKLVNNTYQFIDNARPSKQEDNNFKFVDYESETKGNYYLLYLPLYNGITQLKVGVPSGFTIEQDSLNLKAIEKPVVFYGTSIMQGGVASRPGMNFTAILQRKLNIPVVNLGLSGNGKMEPEVIDLIAKIDASLYVFDCHRNMGEAEVKLNTEPAIRKIKQLRPNIPVLLVEESNFKETFPTPRGKIMKEVFDRLNKEGIKGLFYLEGNKIFGSSTEGTVDGVHPNDAGFTMYANAYEPLLREILKLK